MEPTQAVLTTEIERLPLRFGLVAVMTLGVTDREPYQPPKPDARRRRCQDTNDYIEDCRCLKHRGKD